MTNFLVNGRLQVMQKKWDSEVGEILQIISLFKKSGNGSHEDVRSGGGETEAEVCTVLSNQLWLLPVQKSAVFSHNSHAVQLPGAIPRSQFFYCCFGLMENSCKGFFLILYSALHFLSNNNNNNNHLTGLPLVVNKGRRQVRKLSWKDVFSSCGEMMLLLEKNHFFNQFLFAYVKLSFRIHSYSTSF